MAEKIQVAFTENEVIELREILGLKPDAVLTGRPIIDVLKKLQENVSLSLSLTRETNPLVADAMRRCEEQKLIGGRS